MKKKLLIIAGIAACVSIFSGCGKKNYFDVQSVMNPPSLSAEQKEIENAVREYLGSQIVWKYPLNDGKYSAVICEKFPESDETYHVAFCESAESIGTLHVLFLKKAENKFEVFEDITHKFSDIEKVYVSDINGDDIKETVIFGKNCDDSYSSIYAYRCERYKVSEIDVPKKFLNGINLSE